MRETSLHDLEYFSFPNGPKAALPFAEKEYRSRLDTIRQSMLTLEVDVVLLTSMHNIAYYSGFLYCSFGRPYGCLITRDQCITVSANIDGGQPWRRSASENIVYTDWHRNNFWRAVSHVVGDARVIGIEHDHITLATKETLQEFLNPARIVDMAPATLAQRMVKSDQEIALIREAAQIADLGGLSLKEAIVPGAREIDIAMAGRDAMELAIARRFPDAELRDTWAWFQSGLNTDGAHNPVTSRQVQAGDLLSLNTFPMISGYYAALERTLRPSSACRPIT